MKFQTPRRGDGRCTLGFWTAVRFIPKQERIDNFCYLFYERGTTSAKKIKQYKIKLRWKKKEKKLGNRLDKHVLEADLQNSYKQTTFNQVA